MSIIRVEGLPQKISLAQTVKILAKTVLGQFEALAFAPSHPGGQKGFKACYLRLSERLDPNLVIQRINTREYRPNQAAPYAYIPETLPADLKLPAQRKMLPMKIRKNLKIPTEHRPDQVLLLTYDEIIKEFLYKYTELYKLSSKTAHKLLENLSLTIIERLKCLMRNNPEAAASCFKLSGRYRKAHPHFGDFALVLATLHKLEDAAGEPRTQLSEQDLMKPNHEICVIDNVPYTKANQTCLKYTDRIMKKITEHIDAYDVTPKETDSEEDEARKKVQTELRKTLPYLPLIIKQVVTTHFTQDEKSGFHRMRIYSEPYQPPKESTVPFLKRFNGTRVSRSDRMCNLLLLDVPRDHYARLMAADGTLLGGAKLIIRSSGIQTYTLPSRIREKIMSKMGDNMNPDIAYAETDWSKELEDF